MTFRAIVRELREAAAKQLEAPDCDESVRHFARVIQSAAESYERSRPPCLACDGSGEVWISKRMGLVEDCAFCDGTGNAPCPG